MSNPVSRWVTNVFNAGEKLGHATGIQTTLGPSRQDNSKEQTAARGQAWGALLQNRTYDEQGKIKGTQADHHVTDHTTHTQTVKPSVPNPPEGAKRPMVGTDKPAAKKYGSKSWNNGYTN